MRHLIDRWVAVVALILALSATAESQVVHKKPGFPGITFPLKERFIDLDAEVCPDAGSLELIACSKNTKEHESILALAANPLHIHTALLLVGGRSAEVLDGGEKGATQPPFEGGKIEVSIVMVNQDGREEVRPIADFIRKIKAEPVFIDQPEEKNEDRRFPTSHFTFIGSYLEKSDEASRAYMAVRSGNIVSISYFGDEVVGLPNSFGHENESLRWEINPRYLPVAGTQVKLRLRPL